MLSLVFPLYIDAHVHSAGTSLSSLADFSVTVEEEVHFHDSTNSEIISLDTATLAPPMPSLFSMAATERPLLLALTFMPPIQTTYTTSNDDYITAVTRCCIQLSFL